MSHRNSQWNIYFRTPHGPALCTDLFYGYLSKESLAVYWSGDEAERGHGAQLTEKIMRTRNVSDRFWKG